jgi:hypothetical protein
MTDRHPDLGPLDHWPRDYFAEAKREKEERDRAAAKLKEWNPLGRWTIKIVSSTMAIRHPISRSSMGASATSREYCLVDTWRSDLRFKKFCDAYAGYDTIAHHVGSSFKTEDQAVNFAKNVNKETLKLYGKELSALYILMVENALDNAYSLLHKVREAVDIHKSFVEHNNTLEGNDG